MGEYQAEQRQSPELAALQEAVREQGAQQVATTLELAAAFSDMRTQSPAVNLPHEAWHGVDIGHVTDAAGNDFVHVSLDVMLVHQLLPLAAAHSQQGRQQAQARILQVVTQGSSPSALGTDAADAAQTVQTIQAGLGTVCNSGTGGCFIAQATDVRLVVKVPLQDLEAASSFLAAQAGVHWVTLHSSPRAANYYGTAISQCGQAESTYDVANLANPNYAYDDQGKHPLWDAGLTGAGQIVGMGDTGIDLDSCFFRDSNLPSVSAGNWPLDSTGHKLYNSTVHRKIAMYRALEDTVDGDGHGTHCAGSAAGSFQNNVLSWWVGMAPAARIAFTDIGAGNTGSLAGVPYNLTTGYYPWPYVTGARVHSDSWTTTASTYDANSQNTDLFAWLFQDFLPVYAAGNFGAQLVDGTIAAPSTAKNCISVGASLTALYTDSSSFPVYQPPLDLNSVIYSAVVTGGLKGGGADGVPYTVMLASFGPTLAALVASTASSQLSLVTADPPDGCSPFNTPTAFDGVAVLIQRGNCSFEAKVVNAQAANAAAVFISNTENTGFMRMSADAPTPGFDAPTISIPSASLPRNSAIPLLAALSSGQLLKVKVTTASLPAQRYESLAYFTSIGPTPDGRIKPDIVAPGTTISAHPGDGTVGDTSCQVGIDMGTSMATPIVAGAAAVVRQYFADGWYPNGSPVSQLGFNPSAPLVKAIMLGGAASMQGMTPSSNSLYDGVPLEPAPSVRQGFGRLFLENSLPLSSVQGGPNLQVVDQKPFTAPGQSHKYCVQSTGGAMAITLVWADYPCSPSAATCLVNNLDLTVQASGLAGYTLYGNGEPDSLNNVERVTVNDLDPGIVVITVTAVTLPLQQTYSLAVQGQFSGQLADPYNPGWDHTASTLCNQPTFNVTGPSGISNNKNGSFAFVANGATPNGVQCRLATVAGVTTPSPLQDWAACTSPRVYNNLPDASYIFSVRATSFALQTSQLFTVDTVQPRLTISSFTANARRASASFNAIDNSAVAFTCMLQRTASSTVTASVPLAPTDPPTVLGQFQPCASPMSYSSLPDGGYTLTIQAQDSAGNSNGTPMTRSWTVSMPSGNFAQITGVNATASKISFAAFSTTSGGALPSLECRVQQQSDATDINVDGTSNYTACTSPQTITGLLDGVYTFSARTAGAYAGYQSSVLFTVGAVPPTVTLLAAPLTITTSKTARFVWVSSGDVAFSCSLTRSTALANYSACTSPTSYSALPDGKYIFRVFGTSSVAVVGQAVQVPFTLDTTPPTYQINFMPENSSTPSSITYDAGSPVVYVGHTFSIVFSTSDGTSGSGTSEVLGRLAPMTTSSSGLTYSALIQEGPPSEVQLPKAAPAIASSAFSGLTARQDAAISGLSLPFAIAAAGAKALNASSNASAAGSSPAGQQSVADAAGASTAFQVITSPMTVTLADGTYTFALYAVDVAGNAGNMGEYKLIVGSGDFAPQPPPPPSPPNPPPGRAAGAPNAAALRHRLQSGWAAAWFCVMIVTVTLIRS